MSRFLVLLLPLFLFPPGCDPFETTNSSVDEANAQYEAGEFENAAASYETAREEVPERAELFYDLGTARLALGEYETAETAFTRSLETAGDELRPVVLANLGLARLKLALETEDETLRKEALSKALDALEKAVMLRPDMESTRRNMELVLLHLFPPCSKRDDEFEPNNRPDDARPLEETAEKTLMLCPADKDLYKVELEQGHRLTVDLARTGESEYPAPELLLLDSTGAIVAMGEEEGAAASVQYAALTKGSFFVKVEEKDDEEHPYTLTSQTLPPCDSLQEEFEDNDEPGQAPMVDFKKLIEHQQKQQKQAGGQQQAPPPGLPLRICPGDHDWVSFELEEHESIFLQLLSQPVTGKLKMDITDISGNVLSEGKEIEANTGGSPPGQTGETTKGLAAVMLDAEAGKRYFVHVYGDSDKAEAPAMVIPTIRPPCPEGDDEMEDNDQRDTAAALAAGDQPVEHLLRRCPGDDDWFSLELKKDQAVQVQIGFDHERGDLSLTVYRDDDEAPLITSDRSGPEVHGEGVSLKAEDDAIFYLHVTGPAEATNFYQLQVKPPDKQDGDGKDQDKKDQDKKDQDKKEPQEQEQKKPIEQMMDQMDRKKRPNLEAQKALQKFPNAQAPGGKIW